MQLASIFAARDYRILDGEEGEEETRTKKTMEKQVKLRKRQVAITLAFVSGFRSMKREYLYSPLHGWDAGLSRGNKRIWNVNRIPEHFHNYPIFNFYAERVANRSYENNE